MLYRNVSIAKFEGYTQPVLVAKATPHSCIGMYQLQNLKDIHNIVVRCLRALMLYRNVSIAKFEGYTQLILVRLATLHRCIGMYQLQNLKDIHNKSDTKFPRFSISKNAMPKQHRKVTLFHGLAQVFFLNH